MRGFNQNDSVMMNIKDSIGEFNADKEMPD